MSTVTSALQLLKHLEDFGDDVSAYREQIQRHLHSLNLDNVDRSQRFGTSRWISLMERFSSSWAVGFWKSTLVRCMSRLVEPTAGELTAGQDLLAASEDELIQIRRHKMGMVFQHFALLPHMSVLDNVAFPLEIQGIDKQTREQRASESDFPCRLVWTSRGNAPPNCQVSATCGYRARSLAVEPDIWFLDEPFSALDPLIRRGNAGRVSQTAGHPEKNDRIYRSRF